MEPAPNRGAIVTDTDLGRIHRVFPSFNFDTVLQTTGKCDILSGMVEGQPAIAKLLVNIDRQWIERFRHEIQFYRIAGHALPPVAIPKVYAADERELLVVAERVEGSPLARDRYLDREIDRRTCEQLLQAINAMREWRPLPPTSRQDALTAFQSMVAKGVTEGFTAHQDCTLVVGAVNDLDWAPEFSHGDLLPSNCIVAPDGSTLTLVDWEYADYRLPGYDLALLFMVGLRCSSLRHAIIEAINVSDTSRRLLFLANLAALLTREVRILQQARHVAGFAERQTEMADLLELTWKWWRSAERDSVHFKIQFGDAG